MNTFNRIRKEQYQEKSKGKADIGLAILGVVACVIIIAISVMSHLRTDLIVAVLFPLSAFIIYLVLKIRDHTSVSEGCSQTDISSENKFVTRRMFILVLLFLISIILIFVSYTYRENDYQRPIIFFLFFGVACGITALTVISLPANRKMIAISLTEIICLGVIIRASVYYLYPGEIWFDPWYHKKFTTYIFMSGTIPSGEAYSNLPFMHIIVAITEEVTGLGFKDSSFLTISNLKVIVFSVCTYTITLYLSNNKKISLFGAFIAIITDLSIIRGITIYPNTLGIILVLIVTMLIIRDYLNKNSKFRIAPIIIMTAIVLTHSLSAAIMIIVLLLFWFASMLDRKTRSKKANYPFSPKLLIFYILLVLMWWMYASDYFVELEKLFIFSFSSEAYGTLPYPEVSQYMGSLPWSAYIINRIAFLFLIFMAVLGIMRVFRNNPPQGRYAKAITIIGGFLFFVGYVGAATSLRLFSDRVLFASIPFVAILASFAIEELQGLRIKIRRSVIKKLSALLIALLFGGFGTIMALDNVANFDNPIFSKETSVRRAFFESEIVGMMIVSNISDLTISSDWGASVYIRIVLERDFVPATDAFIFRNFTGLSNTTILIREDMIHNPFDAKGGFYKIDYNLLDFLDLEHFDRISDFGTIFAYQS